jgi:hypothetical protein
MLVFLDSPHIFEAFDRQALRLSEQRNLFVLVFEVLRLFVELRFDLLQFIQQVLRLLERVSSYKCLDFLAEGPYHLLKPFLILFVKLYFYISVLLDYFVFDLIEAI